MKRYFRCDLVRRDWLYVCVETEETGDISDRVEIPYDLLEQEFGGDPHEFEVDEVEELNELNEEQISRIGNCPMLRLVGRGLSQWLPGEGEGGAA
jgi:hypothetical protein